MVLRDTETEKDRERQRDSDTERKLNCGDESHQSKTESEKSISDLNDFILSARHNLKSAGGGKFGSANCNSTHL